MSTEVTRKEKILIVTIITFLFLLGATLAVYKEHLEGELTQVKEVERIVIVPEIKVEKLEVEKYLKFRAKLTNEEYHENLHSDDVATNQQIKERVESVERYVNKHLDGDYRYLIDMYAIIEQETRWTNFYSLDNGLSFGVPSIQFSTIREMLDTNPTKLELRQNTDLQIEGAVLYYKKMLEYHGGDRDMAIIAYNRGYNIKSDPETYVYWKKVNQIKKEINEEIIINHLTS